MLCAVCAFPLRAPAVSIFSHRPQTAIKNNPHKGLFFGGKTALGTTGPMGKTPATENRSTHGMNAPCGTTTDVTVERLLFSKGRGKEEAGDADVGIGGHAGRANQNGAEEAPFVFVGLESGKIIRGGTRRRKRGKRNKRKRIHRIPWRCRRFGLIHRNLDGRRDEWLFQHVRHLLWVRHGGTLSSASIAIQFYSRGGTPCMYLARLSANSAMSTLSCSNSSWAER